MNKMGLISLIIKEIKCLVKKKKLWSDRYRFIRYDNSKKFTFNLHPCEVFTNFILFPVFLTSPTMTDRLPSD